MPPYYIQGSEEEKEDQRPAGEAEVLRAEDAACLDQSDSPTHSYCTGFHRIAVEVRT